MIELANYHSSWRHKCMISFRSMLLWILTSTVLTQYESQSENNTIPVISLIGASI